MRAQKIIDHIIAFVLLIVLAAASAGLIVAILHRLGIL